MQIISKKIVHDLNLPKPSSHKRDNGRLLIVAGHEPKYFGAMFFSIRAASKIVDLIYLLTAHENEKLIARLRIKTGEFILTHKLGKETLADVDCILIGPGMGMSSATKKLTSAVLKSGKKAVLDADALNVLDEKLRRSLSPNHILTPHHKEFYRVFKIAPTAKNASLMAKKYHCTIVLKGPTDVIADPTGKIALNKTGNSGMTKGGTGDVLAGLIASLYTTNEALTSAAAGTYINGAAGDELYKKVSSFYNAEDLVEQLPKTIHRLVNSH